jgi:hypothetical protein
MRTKYNSQRSDKGDKSRGQQGQTDYQTYLKLAVICYKQGEDAAGDRQLKQAMKLANQPEEKFDEYRATLIAEARPTGKVIMCDNCGLLPAAHPDTLLCQECINDYEDLRVEYLREKLAPYSVA